MTTKLLHIEEEDLDIELTQHMSLIVKDKRQDCEIEVSPEITVKLLSYANIIIAGIMQAQKLGLIDEKLEPDWK